MAHGGDSNGLRAQDSVESSSRASGVTLLSGAYSDPSAKPFWTVTIQAPAPTSQPRQNTLCTGPNDIVFVHPVIRRGARCRRSLTRSTVCWQVWQRPVQHLNSGWSRWTAWGSVRPAAGDLGAAAPGSGTRDGGDQGGVVIPAEPGAAFVAVQADSPELCRRSIGPIGRGGRAARAGGGGEVREPVSVGLSLPLGHSTMSHSPVRGRIASRSDAPHIEQKTGSAIPTTRRRPLGTYRHERARVRVARSRADLLGLAVRARAGLLAAGPHADRGGHLDARLGPRTR